MTSTTTSPNLLTPFPDHTPEARAAQLVERLKAAGIDPDDVSIGVH